MRLPEPFIKLPLSVDAVALAREVGTLSPEIWRAHPEGAPGNSAVPLLAVDGDPTNDDTGGHMLPTPYLDALPYIHQLFAGLDTVVGRTRLMRIEEEGELLAHVDTNYYWRDHLRVHLPVVTGPSVQFECAGTSVHMGSGEVWVFDTWQRHRVLNPGRVPRIHLVVDTVGSASLWDLIEEPDQPIRHLAPQPAAPPPSLVTERVNRPTVMTPWEIDQTLEQLVFELDSADGVAADRIDDALRSWRHAWRSEWARTGDDAEGRERFAALLADANRIAEAAAGDARLPNGVLVLEAIRQHVIRPALAQDAPAATSRSATTIDRPVFVVSSPRSGSSLLFEALARAPELCTIGGESHRVIESIAALHPAAHGWDSNRLAAADATRATTATLRHAFARALRDREGRVPPPGPVRMLEKTPKNSLRVPFLATAFPDARFVYLYRDPRETISSMFDAWKSERFVTYPGLPGWTDPPWSLLLVPGWRELIGHSLAEIVTTQWATATELLLDDLEALAPEQWCVASYDRLVGDPQSEITRLCAFSDLAWELELDGSLPLSRHTLDSPHPDKWRRNADALDPHWDRVREVAARAHDVFGAPPRMKPVRPVRPATERAAEPRAENVAPANATTEAVLTPESFKSVHSGALPAILEAAACSLLVSTYQSGRLIIVRSNDGALNTHFRAFASPMGIARRGATLALGTRSEVLLFQNQPAVSDRLEPPGRHDAVFMPRGAHTTGDIRIHDLAFAGEELWAVNTRFSCLVTLDEDHSFVPRWRPPFVTALSPGDRCHLNGIAMVDDRPTYVTALGISDEDGGWREDKATGGVVLDVASGEPVATGLCMPHSPRWHDGRLWVLESGRGVLGVVDLADGTVETVATVPGFARGLGFAGPFAFIGLSQVREHVFEGLPLTAEGVERACGVWVIDTRSGDTAAFLRFEGIVQEIFEVAVLEGIRYPEITEPRAELVDTAFVLPDDAIAQVAQEIRS